MLLTVAEPVLAKVAVVRVTVGPVASRVIVDVAVDADSGPVFPAVSVAPFDAN